MPNKRNNDISHGKFTKETAFVIVGLLFGVIVDKIRAHNYELIAVWSIIALTLIILIIIFISVLNAHNDLNSTLINCIGIATKFLTNTDDHDKAYEESYAIIKNAKEEILIIGDYAPAGQKNEIDTKARQKYFLEIEKIIENKIKYKKKLTYTRIMQRNAEVVKQIKNGGIINEAEQIECDEQAFAHCERVLKLKNRYKQQEEYIKLKIYISTVIPSMPSILLVDKKHLLFTIPQKGDNGLKTEAVLHFTDHHRQPDLIDTFKNIFDSFIDDSAKLNGFSEEIKKILPPLK